MAEQTIIVHINGYWRDQPKSNLPGQAGVFFVYEADYHEEDQTVDLLKLLYIGEADNINSCIHNPEIHSSWMNYLMPGHELCYAYASIDSYYRTRTKAAYIITHKPPGNKNSQVEFHYDTTTLISTGKTALINTVVTARKNRPYAQDSERPSHRKEMIPVRAVQVCSSK